MKLFYLALIFFANLSFSDVAAVWSCKEASWKEEPRLEDGIFSATIQTTCQIEENKSDRIVWLFNKLQTEYQKKEKYEIHKGPVPFQEGELKGLRYDLTDKLSEEGSDIAIRQNVELLTDSQRELRYQTKSTEIQASGTASYLRHVSFQTRVFFQNNSYEVNLENKVIVERPWFALSFLFKPFSAKITEDKFETARNRLLNYLLLPES